MKVSIAKSEFLDRINSLSNTMTEVPTATVLTSIAPLTSSHNEKAKILRNGLAISSFIVFEDFLKNRIGEIIENIKNTAVSFGDFNNRLKAATTIEALDSISYKASNLKRTGEDWISFIQEETKRISISGNSKFKLSKYSLGWNKANVASEDITKWLRILSIKGGWKTIQSITSKAEVTLSSPEDVFRSAALRRHSAAHNPNSESLLTDLIQFINDSKALALAFDVLVTKSLNEINRSNMRVINGVEQLDDSNIDFRFILKSERYWKEYKNTSKRAIRKNFDLKESIKEAKKRATPKNEIILIKNGLNSIVDWIQI